jgi:hypothetical protein
MLAYLGGSIPVTGTMAYADPKDPRAREARLRWYRSNKERQIARQAERKRGMILWVRSQKAACQRCGFDNPVALQFHHLDPSLKDLSVSEAISHGWSKERIGKEIEKCEVLCANCHAIEHSG